MKTKEQLSNASGRYGAAMGRAESHGPNSESYVLSINWIPLDNGGYDPAGAYWGIGAPLYCVESECGTITEYKRAANLDALKLELSAAYPESTIAESEQPAGLDDFLRGYLICALWSSTDDDGNPLDDESSVDDIAPETLEDMKADCAAFLESHVDDLAAAAELRPDYGKEQAGHDFWLSRNGHGAGFFDRGLGETGRKLQEAARVWNSYDLWRDDESGMVRHG